MLEHPRAPMVMDQGDAEAITGYATLPAELFDHLPLGRRIIVIREKPKLQHGRIIVPEMHLKPRTSGWVVAAGPDIGLPNTLTPAAGRWPWDPQLILGAHVTFPFYSGAAFMGDLDDPEAPWVKEAGGADTLTDEFKCPFRLMSDMDIITTRRAALDAAAGNREEMP